MLGASRLCGAWVAIPGFSVGLIFEPLAEAYHIAADAGEGIAGRKTERGGGCEQEDAGFHGRSGSREGSNFQVPSYAGSCGRDRILEVWARAPTHQPEKLNV